ncbi:MAG: tyrosine-type recombinase/integrase [Lachnospiraceae bacterium]|nr:tyrosine-type recombinase/integrase [Lachnospiraceae bacterium]
MHSLRHSFATRAIERGVNPKAFQTLLGHASVQVTMGIYVHITDDSKWLTIAQFEGKSSVVTESTSNGVEPENKMA